MRLNLTGRLDVAADASIDLASYDSASVVLYFPDGYNEFVGGVNYLWSQDSANFYFGAQGGIDRFLLKHGSDTSTGVFSTPAGEKSLGYSWSDGNQPDFYKEGVFATQGSIALNKQSPLLRSVSIGSVSGAYIRQIPSTFGVVLATNRALTADEHYKVYTELSR
jgi:hypothetical protein